MKRKILLFLLLVSALSCMLALAVSAECNHTDSWEIKTGDNGFFEEWEAINVCPECGYVIADEFYSPIITSMGYSTFEDSFVQGFMVDRLAMEKYEEYTGQTFEYGIVAGVTSVVGNAPLDSEGNVTNGKAVTYDLSKNSVEHFEIKVVNIPNDRRYEKIIACAYALIDGKVVYSDNGGADTQVCGASVNEVKGLLENGTPVSGLYEYRELTAEEMDILFARYWMSNHSKEYGVRRSTENSPQKFAATRMFSRSELPKGTVVVVANGWNIRPEVWELDEDGNVKKQSNRPGTKGAGTYAIETLWQDTVASDGTVTESKYDCIGFNISEGSGGFVDQMSLEGITQVFKIYVPYTTYVEKTEINEEENVSVEGFTLKKWTADTLLARKFRNNQNSATSISSGDQYYATGLFTRETLPVGSVIEINEGWICRIEYWMSNGSKAGNRGPMSAAYRIEITEEFWEGYSYRSLNISTVDKDKLSANDWDKIASAIRIYVPTK